MTIEQLNALNKKELADKARRLGIAVSGTTRKEDLVRAIDRALKKKAREREKAAAAAAEVNGKPHGHANGKPPADAPVALNGKAKHKPAAARTVPPPAAKSRAAKMVRRDATAEEANGRPRLEGNGPTRDLSAKMPRTAATGHAKDRIVVMVRDPYWLHVYWELTHQAVQRAEAALGQDWHGVRPILRLLDVSSNDTTSTAESVVKDIDIHGGCNNWYVEVSQPPRSYRVDIGYLSRRGQFYVLARSNTVTTPKAGVSETLDENWSDFDPKQAERIFAMSNGFDPTVGGSLELKQLFEERLRRPMGSPAVTSFGSGALLAGKDRKFFFEINAELIVYGRTEANARVTLQGEPVKLRPDGTFTMRYNLPDSRQIIPAVAQSADGVEERTIVLAVERNTKQLEPMIHDNMNENV